MARPVVAVLDYEIGNLRSAQKALERVGAGGADVTDRGIDIWADTVIDVVIGRQTEVAGQVVDADDGPIPGVPVVVFAEDRLLWTLPRSRYVSVSVAGADGRFRVTGLPPGRYRAAAVFEATEGQIVDVESLGQFVPRATNFAVARGERVSIRVRVR